VQSVRFRGFRSSFCFELTLEQASVIIGLRTRSYARQFAHFQKPMHSVLTRCTVRFSLCVSLNSSGRSENGGVCAWVQVSDEGDSVAANLVLQNFAEREAKLRPASIFVKTANSIRFTPTSTANSLLYHSGNAAAADMLELRPQQFAVLRLPFSLLESGTHRNAASVTVVGVPVRVPGVGVVNVECKPE
jgi:hypothetical protein